MKPEGKLEGGDAGAGTSAEVQIADMVVSAFSVCPVRGNAGKCDADVAKELRPTSHQSKKDSDGRVGPQTAAEALLGHSKTIV